MPIQAAQQFEQTVKERLTRATNESGHSFAGIYKIVEDKGAVGAAKMLIRPANTGKINDGLKALVDRNLSHLSIEQAVIDFANQGLFSEKEISSARDRLALARMKSGKTNVSERLKKGD
jgi:hypothetical protein